ncbi:MAG: CPBP family glutamic-type intramembrane protease [Pseudonocardiaceae bacterium]
MTIREASSNAPLRPGGDRRGAGLGRALLGASAMAVALGASTALGTAVTRQLDVTGTAAKLVPAVLCSAIAVAIVLTLRVRWDRRPLAGIGLTGPRTSIGAFLLGVTVTLGSATVVLAAATVVGWLHWTSVDGPRLLLFVLVSGVISLLFEALPEELTLRGYTWTSLRERHRAAIATVVTTALFLAVPAASTLVHAGISTALGGTPSPIGIAPPGEDPLSYLILLLMFGLTLIAARTATASWSVWTCIGTHLTFLTVNRVTLFGQQRGAGWSAEPTTPDAILLIPAYLGVTTLAYLTIAYLRRRRSARQATPASALWEIAGPRGGR